MKIVSSGEGRSCPVPLPKKDRPILEAAIRCKATHLLTGDRKHFGPFMCELAWVLESAYGVGKAELLEVFERILRTAQFEIPGKDLVWRSFADYRAGRGDFSDHLLGRLNEDADAPVTITFDRALRGNPRFHVLTVG